MFPLPLTLSPECIVDTVMKMLTLLFVSLVYLESIRIGSFCFNFNAFSLKKTYILNCWYLRELSVDNSEESHLIHGCTLVSRYGFSLPSKSRVSLWNCLRWNRIKKQLPLIHVEKFLSALRPKNDFLRPFCYLRTHLAQNMSKLPHLFWVHKSRLVGIQCRCPQT